jgi:hypothetical protein
MPASRLYATCRGEWRRLVLYALTDALTYNCRAVGSVTACLPSRSWP